jgi:DNA-binding Lrp family transcriptional regulator
MPRSGFRISRELAAVVGARLRRLQRDGIIRRWTIDADLNALGLDVLATAFSYAF